MLPPKEHRLKYPNLERNTYVAIFVTILVLTVGCIFIAQEVERAKIQHAQEQQALRNGNAVEVTIEPKVQRIPEWVFEVRKMKP